MYPNGYGPILKLDISRQAPYHHGTMTHKLEFDEPSHTYRLNGITVPSVTTILKPLSGLDKVPSAILEKAAAYGTAVHYATELYDRAELDEASLPDEFRNAMDAYKGFLLEHDPEWIAIECRTFHPALMYAGTVDRVCKIDGKTYVLDIKTSSIPPYPPSSRRMRKLPSLPRTALTESCPSNSQKPMNHQPTH